MNRLTKTYLIWLILATGIFVSHAALSAGESATGATTTKGEHFRVSYQSKVDPLPLNRIHSWVLHVETLDGKPVDNATVSVTGGMPAHSHGLPTQPEATEIGNGDYLVQGMKFSMTGLWEMWFNIETTDTSERVKFVIEF